MSGRKLPPAPTACIEVPYSARTRLVRTRRSSFGKQSISKNPSILLAHRLGHGTNAPNAHAIPPFDTVSRQAAPRHYPTTCSYTCRFTNGPCCRVPRTWPIKGASRHRWNYSTGTPPPPSPPFRFTLASPAGAWATFRTSSPHEFTFCYSNVNVKDVDLPRQHVLGFLIPAYVIHFVLKQLVPTSWVDLEKGYTLASLAHARTLVLLCRHWPLFATVASPSFVQVSSANSLYNIDSELDHSVVSSAVPTWIAVDYLYPFPASPAGKAYNISITRTVSASLPIFTPFPTNLPPKGPLISLAVNTPLVGGCPVSLLSGNILQ